LKRVTGFEKPISADRGISGVGDLEGCEKPCDRNGPFDRGRRQILK
jgi:hypothetical protein